MVRVVSHQRRQIECYRQPAAAMLQEVLVTLVGLLRRGETGELAHRPKLAPIPGRVNATRKGRLARIPKVFFGAPVFRQVSGRVEPADGNAGNGRVAGIPVLVEVDAGGLANRLLGSFL